MATKKQPADSGEATTSTSAEDASTTQGQSASGIPQPEKVPSSAGGAATAEQAAAQRIIIEQPEPAPEVHYEGVNDPNRPHVKAEYSPFTW